MRVSHPGISDHENLKKAHASTMDNSRRACKTKMSKDASEREQMRRNRLEAKETPKETARKGGEEENFQRGKEERKRERRDQPIINRGRGASAQDINTDRERAKQRAREPSRWKLFLQRPRSPPSRAIPTARNTPWVRPPCRGT